MPTKNIAQISEPVEEMPITEPAAENKRGDAWKSSKAAFRTRKQAWDPAEAI